MKWWIVVAALIAVLTFWKGKDVVQAVADYTTRGKKLTDDEGDSVQTSFVDLVSAASAVVGREISDEAYALARMIRSEQGRNTVLAKIAAGYVAINDARTHGWGLIYTLTFNKNRPTGTFGSQRGGRYATTRDPYENDLAIAEAILNGKEPDPSQGKAVKFVNKSSFGVQPGTKTYEDTVASWAKDGLKPLELDGVGDLVLFVKG